VRVVVLCDDTSYNSADDSTQAEKLPRIRLQILASIRMVFPSLHYHEPVHNYIHKSTGQVHEEAKDADIDWILEVDHSDGICCREL